MTTLLLLPDNPVSLNRLLPGETKAGHSWGLGGGGTSVCTRRSNSARPGFLFSNGLPNAMVVDLLFHRQDRALICANRNQWASVMSVP